MKKDPQVYVEHIIESIDKILNYTRNMDEDAFLLNDLVKDAVVKNFEVIGEATKNIPVYFISANPDIPWKNMAGMRDKLIHDYAGIDYWKVWDSVVTDIPQIKKQLENISLKNYEHKQTRVVEEKMKFKVGTKVILSSDGREYEIINLSKKSMQIKKGTHIEQQYADLDDKRGTIIKDIKTELLELV